MGPSDAHFGPPQPRTVEGQRPPRLRGPPVLRRVLSLRAVPTTPASHPEPGGCPSPGYGGLPRVRVGSALATALSGPAQGSLAFGPQICWPSFRGLFSERLDVIQLPEDRPPVATRLNRQLPRQDFHLQERATFARRTLTFQGPEPAPSSRPPAQPSSSISCTASRLTSARAGFSGAAEGRVGGTRLLSAVGFLVGFILTAIQ